MIGQHFETLSKASDAALWYNFIHQSDGEFCPIAVTHGANDDFVLLELCELESMGLEPIPIETSLKELSFHRIQSIGSDTERLEHWEEIFGHIATIPLDVLRFILATEIPLDKIIKYYLSARGIDSSGKWIGFDQAEILWLDDKDA